MQLKGLKYSPMLPGKRRLASAASLEKYASCCHEDTPAAEENRPAAVQDKRPAASLDQCACCCIHRARSLNLPLFSNEIE
jgi:hypothetical protein